MSAKRVGSILLAAGGSSRLGQLKQLLHVEGQTLVRRAATAAIGAGCDPVTVVVGAEAEKISDALEALSVRIVVNASWAAGMGTSIRLGAVSMLAASPALVGVVVLLCDQPYLTSPVITQLVEGWLQSGKPMAASVYDTAILGPPCCFSRPMLKQLLALPDKSGARHILDRDPSLVHRFAWPDGKFDIDTPADWVRLNLSSVKRD